MGCWIGPSCGWTCCRTFIREKKDDSIESYTKKFLKVHFTFMMYIKSCMNCYIRRWRSLPSTGAINDWADRRYRLTRLFKTVFSKVLCLVPSCDLSPTFQGHYDGGSVISTPQFL